VRASARHPCDPHVNPQETTMQPVAITFKFTKTTTNYHRFDEPGEKKSTTGSFYVRKELMPTVPAEITVMVTPA
jgi:hypothetical protein